MSIAFNVNDNLSISYGETTETYDAQSNVKGGTEIEDVDQDIESLQLRTQWVECQSRLTLLRLQILTTIQMLKNK